MLPEQEDQDKQLPPLMFSKAGVTSPVGNLEHRISTDVDGETFLAFTKLVRECGTDRAGAVRDWVFLQVHGQTFTDMVRAAEKVNRDRLFGTAPDQVLNKQGASQ